MLQRVVLLLCCLAALFAEAQTGKQSIPVIFDTDMGPDYDDVGAITLLHAFADSGEVQILATMASTKYEGVAAVLSVFNTYFNRPGVPIGVPRGKAVTLRDWQHWTDTLIARYPHTLQMNADAEDAVALYRRILARQADRSVTIITTGFLTNVSNLLLSKADDLSPLDGAALVAQKVKQLVCMAGRFPSGSEFNVNQDIAASQNVFSHWPTPVLLSGFEIGQKIKTGLPLVRNLSIVNSPVKTVFSICLPKAAEDSAGRMSWDETAVLVAVKGPGPFYHPEYGRMAVADDGSDTWTSQGNQQARLIEAVPPKNVEEYINRLMMHQPVTKVQ